MVKLKGKIWFDPKNVTRKHNSQADWKRVAMVIFDDDDTTEYYSWFIKKRYNLQLNRPLRGPHVTFINDSIRDMGDVDKWDEVKAKYHGTEVTIILDLDVRSDAKHWWLIVEHESRKPLLDIRSELGMGKPYYGMHLSIGYANEKNVDHSKYILNLITTFGGSYN